MCGIVGTAIGTTGNAAHVVTAGDGATGYKVGDMHTIGDHAEDALIVVGSVVAKVEGDAVRLPVKVSSVGIGSTANGRIDSTSLPNISGKHSTIADASTSVDGTGEPDEVADAAYLVDAVGLSRLTTTQADVAQVVGR